MNFILHIRPNEIFGIDVPFFLIAMVPLMVAMAGPIFQLLAGDVINTKPIIATLIGYGAAIFITDFAGFRFHAAITHSMDYLKCAIYFMVLLSVLTTEKRLDFFLVYVVLVVVFVAAISELNFRQVVQIESIRHIERNVYDLTTGTTEAVGRLSGPGIYNDPNDMCQILLLGTIAACYCIRRYRSGLIRAGAILAIVLFMFTFADTRSRGGLISLAVAVYPFFQRRFGMKRSVILWLVLIPVMLFLFSGRQGQMNVSDREDTAQMRVELWYEAFQHLREHPVFGMGVGQFLEAEGYVAHNSFVQAYAETGMIGGTFFAGLFFFALWGASRVRKLTEGESPPFIALGDCLGTMVLCYAAGIFSLTRNFSPALYMVIGLATAYLRLVERKIGAPVYQKKDHVVKRLLVASLATLIALNLFVRLSLLLRTNKRDFASLGPRTSLLSRSQSHHLVGDT